MRYKGTVGNSPAANILEHKVESYEPKIVKSVFRFMESELPTHGESRWDGLLLRDRSLSSQD